MTQYWLTDLNLNKIEDLSKYLIEQGFKASHNMRNEFAEQYDLNRWETEERHISIYSKNHPIFIEVPLGESKISQKDKGLIKKMIEITGTKRVINGLGNTVPKTVFLAD